MPDSTVGSVLPRSVLIADGSLYREISQNPDSVGLLEDLDSMIIPLSGNPAAHKERVDGVRHLLEEAGQLVGGALLIRDPYERASFEFAEYAIETFASAKYHILANVARLLGAKEVRFVEAKVERVGSEWRANAKGKIPAGGGNVDVSSEVSKKLEQRLEGQMTFPGAEPLPDDARDYLRERNLAHDHQLRDLVEMRTGTNLITRYKMTLSGTRESARNLKSGLKITNAGPVKAADIGAGFAKVVTSINSVEIRTEITF